MVGGSPASSTTKTGRHSIAAILLKAPLNRVNQIKHVWWQREENMADNHI
jgi:hypothetical protein